MRSGHFNALGLSKAKGSGFLLASTSEVYGDPLVRPQPESYWGNVNPIGPRGVYDEAKRYAEAITMAYLHAHGGSDVVFTERPIDDPEVRSPDISRATSLLGWVPRISLTDGLARTINWARETWRA